MRIVAERALNAPRGLLIGEPRRQVQRYVDADRYARRGDEPAVFYPPPTYILGPELLQDLVVGSVGGRLPALEEPGRKDESPG